MKTKTVQNLTNATASVCANEGDHHGMIQNVIFEPLGLKPSLSLQIVVETKTSRFFAYHNMSLKSTPSMEIGSKQIASAFPKLLKASDPASVIDCLMEKTDEFIGLPVVITISTQMDNGKAKIDAKGKAYPNVRLQSAMRNLGAKDRKSILQSLGLAKSRTPSRRAAPVVTEASV